MEQMLVILYTCLYQYTDVGKFFCNFVQAVEASVRLRKYSIKTKGEVNSPHFLRFHFPVPQPSILMSFDIVTGTVEMESESDSAKSSAMMRASGPLGSLQSDSALRSAGRSPTLQCWAGPLPHCLCVLHVITCMGLYAYREISRRNYDSCSEGRKRGRYQVNKKVIMTVRVHFLN